MSRPAVTVAPGGKAASIWLHCGENGNCHTTEEPAMRAARYLRLSKLSALLLLMLCLNSTLGEEDFAPLFDGKSLTGWEGNEKVFRVEKGVIVAGSLEQKVEHNEFLCTVKEYGDFELRLKAKLVGEGDNAGVQFRSSRIPNHHEVSGYQCDMGTAFGGIVWGELYDESRRNKMLARGDQAKIKEAFKKGDWNELRVKCVGPHIQIWLNGLQTIDYTETDDKIARRGVFGLQVHGGKPA